jgi:D-beta-D-heptose 7-phosphate kinase/D-beta-D-heptose 1-phosphate adenosyltransferase
LERLSKDRIRDILRSARDVRVLVVGDLMLDRYLTGEVERISPEAPVPVVHVSGESSAVGGAGNVAANVVGLGAACHIVGCIGDDLEGRLLKEELAELGVETEGVVQSPDRPTTVKTRVLARRQQVVRVDREEAADVSDEVARSLLAQVGARAAESQAMGLQDYNKGVLVPDLIAGALEAARSAACPVVVDPKRLRFFEYAGAAVFKPNSKELEDALGERLEPDNPEWMERVRGRLLCDSLLLTLGEHGIALQSSRDGYLRVPTVARSVYDVSGAGDTVTAVISVALAAGASPTEAAILANHAAAIEVGKTGVAPVYPEEILDQYGNHMDE